MMTVEDSTTSKHLPLAAVKDSTTMKSTNGPPCDFVPLSDLAAASENRSQTRCWDVDTTLPQSYEYVKMPDTLGAPVRNNPPPGWLSKPCPGPPPPKESSAGLDNLALAAITVSRPDHASLGGPGHNGEPPKISTGVNPANKLPPILHLPPGPIAGLPGLFAQPGGVSHARHKGTAKGTVHIKHFRMPPLADLGLPQPSLNKPPARGVAFYSKHYQNYMHTSWKQYGMQPSEHQVLRQGHPHPGLPVGKCHSRSSRDLPLPKGLEPRFTAQLANLIASNNNTDPQNFHFHPQGLHQCPPPQHDSQSLSHHNRQQPDHHHHWPPAREYRHQAPAPLHHKPTTHHHPPPRENQPLVQQPPQQHDHHQYLLERSNSNPLHNSRVERRRRTRSPPSRRYLVPITHIIPANNKLQRALTAPDSFGAQLEVNSPPHPIIRTVTPAHYELSAQLRAKRPHLYPISEEPPARRGSARPWYHNGPVKGKRSEREDVVRGDGGEQLLLWDPWVPVRAQHQRPNIYATPVEPYLRKRPPTPQFWPPWGVPQGRPYHPPPKQPPVQPLRQPWNKYHPYYPPSEQPRNASEQPRNDYRPQIVASHYQKPPTLHHPPRNNPPENIYAEPVRLHHPSLAPPHWLASAPPPNPANMAPAPPLHNQHEVRQQRDPQFYGWLSPVNAEPVATKWVCGAFDLATILKLKNGKRTVLKGSRRSQTGTSRSESVVEP